MANNLLSKKVIGSNAGDDSKKEQNIKPNEIKSANSNKGNVVSINEYISSNANALETNKSISTNNTSLVNKNQIINSNMNSINKSSNANTTATNTISINMDNRGDTEEDAIENTDENLETEDINTKNTGNIGDIGKYTQKDDTIGNKDSDDTDLEGAIKSLNDKIEEDIKNTVNNKNITVTNKT